MKDQKKILLRLLKEIKEKENIPNYKDYKLTKDDFGYIVEMAKEEKLISKAEIIRGDGGHIASVELKDAYITTKGLDYLEQNKV
jgi:hypothetical protein